MREPKLLEGRSQDVLDNNEARIRGDDESLGAEGAVGHVARVFVEQRHGRDELPDQRERGVDVQRQLALFGKVENLRQTHAGDALGDERQRGAVLQAIDASDASVIRMTKIRQATDALAQCELERRNRRQVRAETQEFERVGAGGVRNVAPLTQWILKHDACGS